MFRPFVGIARTSSRLFESRLFDLRLLVACTSLTLSLFGSPAYAKGPPPSIEIKVQISEADGVQSLVPSALAFERGRLYKLLISNETDKSRHFTASGLATRVFSRKVEVIGASGKMLAEVHGQANNFELSPGARVAWYFYPMINGTDIAMSSRRRSEVPAIGTVTITGAPPILNSAK